MLLDACEAYIIVYAVISFGCCDGFSRGVLFRSLGISDPAWAIP